MPPRVVITGIGVVSPIGCDRDEFWKSCMAGGSGVRRLESPWVTETGLSCQIAATVPNFDAEQANLPRKQARVLDRTSLFAIGAADDALGDLLDLVQCRHQDRQQHRDNRDYNQQLN